MLTISLPQHPYKEDEFQISRILISRLQADSGKSLLNTSNNKLPQQNKAQCRKEIGHLQTDRLPDCLDDPRIL